MAKKYKIWSTAEVNDNIQRMAMGQEFDSEPFYANDPDLRAANVRFNWTPEEFNEYVKCSQDCIYFVQKYCNFLTDKGRMPVRLRGYQKRILSALTMEEFKPKVGELGPANRNVALCQSRQSGKCLVSDTKVELPTGKVIKVRDMEKPNNFSVIYKVKQILYKIYEKL